MPAASTPVGIMNALTVDVEDYFHTSALAPFAPRDRWDSLESRVCASTDRLLEMFDEAQVCGTFFVLGWVAERFPELVRRIANHGHEIGSHGYAHRLVYDETPSGFREDVRRARGLLEDMSGIAVHGFRAPSYSVTMRSLWALEILIEEGYQYDSSIFPIRHDTYGIPESPRHSFVMQRRAGTIIEVPASTVRYAGFNLPVAGGAYLRILPFAWTRWGIRRLNDGEQKPAIVYIHPWEVDPDQPRLAAAGLSRFRHYSNLDSTEGRLRALVREFRFGPMRSLLAHHGYDHPQQKGTLYES